MSRFAECEDCGETYDEKGTPHQCEGSREDIIARAEKAEARVAELLESEEQRQRAGARVNISFATHLWAVVADTGGAHEAECVYSVWTSRSAAEAERVRLVGENVAAGCYGGAFHVVAFNADQSSNEWLGVHDRSGAGACVTWEKRWTTEESDALTDATLNNTAHLSPELLARVTEKAKEDSALVTKRLSPVIDGVRTEDGVHPLVAVVTMLTVVRGMAKVTGTDAIWDELLSAADQALDESLKEVLQGIEKADTEPPTPSAPVKP